MPAMSNIPTLFVKRAASADKNSLYIALAIVFGAIGLVCLLITIYLLSRLRRNDRKLDRELAQNTSDNKEFAPQFLREKTYHDDFPRPPVLPPSLPADIIQPGHPMPMPHVVPPSPTPMRPVRRPSSLFDRKRASGAQRMADPFADQQDHHNSAASYMPPVWQAPTHQQQQYHGQQHSVDLHITAPDAVALGDEDLLPPRMGQQPRPESEFSIYSAYGQTAGTEAPPIQTRERSGSQPGRAPSFHRSPSLLRQLLADRAAKAGMAPPPPPPPMPQPKPQLRLARPETALNTGLMPYDLETATPGPTPIDVPPISAMSTATHVIDARLDAYGYQNGGTMVSMNSIREDDEDPFTDAQDPHSAARMTLLQPPPSPPKKSPPPLTITIPNSHTKGMMANGFGPLVGPSVAPPAIPVRSPERTNNSGVKVPRKPVMQRPPPPTYVTSHGNGSGLDLANFAAKLRPDTRDFNAEPVAIPDERDGGDFRITMRP